MKEEIRHWIQQINDETILPSDIVAFNFGLFESEERYCIYLTGSIFYDESDDDWACDIDYETKWVRGTGTEVNPLAGQENLIPENTEGFGGE